MSGFHGADTGLLALSYRAEDIACRSCSTVSLPTRYQLLASYRFRRVGNEIRLKPDRQGTSRGWAVFAAP